MPAGTWRPWRLPNLRSGGEGRVAGRKEGNAVFRRRITLRPMRLMVDAALAHPAAEDEQVQYLLELTDEACFERYLYADDGPPPDIPRKHLDDCSMVVEGWVCTQPGHWPHVIDVVYGQGERFTWTGAWREDPRFALLSVAPPPDAYRDLSDPAARMRADLTALLVAEAIDADLFITERAYLLEEEIGLAREATVLPPREALPVIGLYLRLQDVYRIRHSRFMSSFGGSPPRWLFFWAAAHHVLPASARWSRACGEHAQASGDDDFSYLAASLHHRVAGALDARDRLLGVLAVPQGNQGGEDALTLLTQICLWLMGAFDVAAQVAHRSLGLPPKQERYAAWQDPDWRQRVAAHDAALGRLTGIGSEGAHVLTILGEIRNSIHGEVLSSLGFQQGSDNPLETLVGIPRSRQAALLTAVDALGGREAWGAKVLVQGDLHVHPGDFTEELVVRALRLLDALMAATPVLRLRGATPGSEEVRSPREDTDPFHPMLERAGKRVRWQLGL